MLFINDIAINIIVQIMVQVLDFGTDRKNKYRLCVDKRCKSIRINWFAPLVIMICCRLSAIRRAASYRDRRKTKREI